MKGYRKYIILFSISLIVSGILLEFSYLPWKKLTNKTWNSIKGKPDFVTYDSAGIPWKNYGYYADSIYIGKNRSPVAIAQEALKYYDDIGSDTISKQKFLNCAAWLQHNTYDTLDYSLLLYHFPWPNMHMTPPWRSDMAQGQALDVLAKAYYITKDSSFIITGDRIVNSFLVEVQNGGVTHKDNDTSWWYEEYADENGKNPRVLNGMIYTLLGIYQYYDITGNELAYDLFDKGINSLKANLPEYDMNGYSYYNVLGNPASSYYHKDHIQLLERIYEIRNEEIFKTYHSKWAKSLFIKTSVYKGIVKKPNKLNIFIFGVNFLVVFMVVLFVAMFVKRVK